jgi:Glycosyl transferase family 2
VATVNVTSGMLGAGQSANVSGAPEPIGDRPIEILADPIELTVLLPCLNEAETLEVCIDKAQRSLRALGVDGEVLVADNGSTDGSLEIAARGGARVVNVPERGYGAALIGGIHAARGRFVIMADADDSYDLQNLGPFLEELRAGAELVMGNRFKGGINSGAMGLLHRVGNPILSGIGRRFFRLSCSDLHCGIRGFRRSSVEALELRSPGMEFASEMVVKAAIAHLRIVEVPTTLSKDGRSRKPHLRTWHDGWRHLRFLLLYSPRWLFFWPGVLLSFVGATGTILLATGAKTIGGVVFDVKTELAMTLLACLGCLLVMFAAASRSFACAAGLLPRSERFRWWQDTLPLERIIVIGVVLALIGAVGWILATLQWSANDLESLKRQFRMLIPSSGAALIGFELIFAAFLVSADRVLRPDSQGEQP